MTIQLIRNSWKVTQLKIVKKVLELLLKHCPHGNEDDIHNFFKYPLHSALQSSQLKIIEPILTAYDRCLVKTAGGG